MKRLCAMVILICLAAFSGCSLLSSSKEAPVLFYYQRPEYLYGQEDSVIAAEEREGAGHITDPKYLLQLYLLGPHDDELVSPFPEGVKVTSVLTTGGVVQITLSRDIASLPEASRTLACACLALTCLDITGEDAVTILWDGGSITLDHSCLTLFDSSSQVSDK